MKADKVWNRHVKPFSTPSIPLVMHERVERMKREVRWWKNLRRFTHRTEVLVCEILAWSNVTAFYTNPRLLHSHWCNIIKLETQ
jgi:hypothetical protein